MSDVVGRMVMVMDEWTILAVCCQLIHLLQFFKIILDLKTLTLRREVLYMTLQRFLGSW